MVKLKENIFHSKIRKETFAFFWRRAKAYILSVFQLYIVVRSSQSNRWWHPLVLFSSLEATEISSLVEPKELHRFKACSDVRKIGMRNSHANQVNYYCANYASIGKISISCVFRMQTKVMILPWFLGAKNGCVIRNDLCTSERAFRLSRPDTFDLKPKSTL